MKKTLVTVLVLSLIVALSACGELATTQQNPTTTPTTAETQPITQAPETQPTAAPTEAPTQVPTQAPAETPTQAPTEAPAEEPTQAPTAAPAQAPTEAAPAPQPTAEPTQAATKQALSREQAINTALQAAGLSKDGVTDLEAELDKERNGLFWEVSFETKTTEYDYEINAYDGTVVKAEKEKEDGRPAQQPTQPSTQPVAAATISRERAIEIALENAGLSKENVTELEAELDEERQVLYWEVSFETREKEYSYEINATDGKIAKAESERND